MAFGHQEIILKSSRNQFKQGLLKQHERSAREYDHGIEHNFPNTSDFWQCHQCRRISYDLLHGTFTPGPTFNIDVHLQRLVLKGFYTLFPVCQPSNQGLSKAQVKKKEKLQNCWRFLFLNACHAIRDRKHAISLSMDETHYKKGAKYHCRYWNYGELRTVVDAAVSVGYFRKYLGQQGDVSFITRLQVTDKLRQLFDGYANENKEASDGDLPDSCTGYDLIQCMPLPRPDRAPVVIKHEDGSYTEPSRTSNVIEAMCWRVEKYNNFMRGQEILLPINISKSRTRDLETLIYSLSRNEIEIIQEYNTTENQTIHTPTTDPLNNLFLLNDNNWISYPIVVFRFIRCNCQRIFSGNMQNGGRFYGTVVQQLPKEIRSKITINGHPVSELDYKALHPSLLYSSIGIQPPADIYVFENSEDKQARGLMKLVALIAFNAADKREAFNAIRLEYREKHDVMLTNDVIQDGVDLFFDHNPDLGQFYLKGVGAKLQYQDSQIMDKILSQLMKKGIPAIPVHDSVMVPSNPDVEMVEEIMIKAYQAVTKTDHVPLIS